MIINTISVTIDFLLAIGLILLGYIDLSNPATWKIQNARYWGMGYAIGGFLLLLLAIAEVIW